MLIIIISLIVIIAVVFIHHQNRLKRQAFLMQEAIRNRDFQFRISTRGLPWGERAMQEALNTVGQELKRQIAASEVESWRKLTRVLTHEIMNATAPIASISQSFLSRDDVKGMPIEDGIRAIHDTCNGLNSFVENYRKFTQLQNPQFNDVRLRSLMEGVKPLFPTLVWNVSINDDVVVNADEGLLRQVIINLAKNATEAGAKRVGVFFVSALNIRYHYENVRTQCPPLLLVFSNDGPPIPACLCRDIFTPFFTTKKTGSGVGLSLSRQIMVMQDGDLVLADKPLPGYHVTFILSSTRWV